MSIYLPIYLSIHLYIYKYPSTGPASYEPILYIHLQPSMYIVYVYCICILYMYIVYVYCFIKCITSINQVTEDISSKTNKN